MHDASNYPKHVQEHAKKQGMKPHELAHKTARHREKQYFSGKKGHREYHAEDSTKPPSTGTYGGPHVEDHMKAMKAHLKSKAIKKSNSEMDALLQKAIKFMTHETKDERQNKHELKLQDSIRTRNKTHKPDCKNLKCAGCKLNKKDK